MRKNYSELARQKVFREMELTFKAGGGISQEKQLIKNKGGHITY